MIPQLTQQQRTDMTPSMTLEDLLYMLSLTLLLAYRVWLVWLVCRWCVSYRVWLVCGWCVAGVWLCVAGVWLVGVAGG